MRNVELKAQLPDRAGAEACCTRIGAIYQGDIHQVDTYFRVPEGRLKLREKEPGGDELIFYRRADIAEAKASEYHISPATSELKTLFSEAFGVVAVVDKVRGLWLWENVRIHLDRVEGIGDFIEFEAVLDDEHDDADGHRKIQGLRQTFQIASTALIQRSYLDLSRDLSEAL